MRIENLSLEHEALLFERLKNTHTFLSEYSFANLYLFRQAHKYQVLFDADEYFIAGTTYDGHRYIMPTRDVRQLPAGQLKAVSHDYEFIFPIPEDWLSAFKDSSIWKECSDADSDYVYTIKKIATYAGHKLHGKRNLLHQFLSLYSVQPMPLTENRIPEALTILEGWQTDVAQAREETDFYPCQEALSRYNELKLCGEIYYVGAQPAGFIIGEEFNKTCFALHFVKGRRSYKGLYHYMYNHFAKVLTPRYEIINFEQDLGKLALQIAKSSYEPDQKLKKYRIRFTQTTI